MTSTHHYREISEMLPPTKPIRGAKKSRGRKHYETSSIKIAIEISKTFIIEAERAVAHGPYAPRYMFYVKLLDMAVKSGITKERPYKIVVAKNATGKKGFVLLGLSGLTADFLTPWRANYY